MKIKQPIWFFITFFCGSVLVADWAARSNKRIGSRVWAEELIRKVARDIKASPQGSVYLADVDPDKLTYDYRLELVEAKGSVIRWRVEKDSKWVLRKTHDESYQIGTVEFPYQKIIASATSISIEVYVAFKGGDWGISSDQSFVISQNPRTVIGYSVITKGKTKILQNGINQIIQNDIQALPKASIKYSTELADSLCHSYRTK